MNKTMRPLLKFDRQEKTNLPIFRTSRQGRVLLVETDADIRQTLKTLLNSQGYEVYVAEDIGKAYTMSAFRGYSFILFNRNMENEAEGNLCKQIRVVNKATPLFFYNNQEQEIEPDNSPEINVQDYDAQSITTNAMLKTIFLRIGQNRTTQSLADDAVAPEARRDFLSNKTETNILSESMPAKRICAWCTKDIGSFNASETGTGRISHGICADCYDLQMRDLQALDISHNNS